MKIENKTPFLLLKSDISDKELKCMVDSGSTISLIKRSVLKNNVVVRPSRYTMTGANRQKFFTDGSVFTLCYSSRKNFPIIFHIVEDSVLPREWSAIIGFDFIENCIVDYKNNTIDLTQTIDVKSFFNHSNIRLELLISRIDVSHLKSDQAKKLLDLIAEFSDVFYVAEFDKLKATNVLEHSVEMLSDKKIFVKQYPVPHQLKPIMKKMALKMLDDGVIKRTMSPYNSPVILVKKKSDSGEKKYRFVVDFREINKNLKPSFFSLPKINDIFDKLRGSSIFSSPDLVESFLQIPVKEEHQEVLAFSVPDCGRFTYCRVPYGLQSSSFVFQHMIETVFRSIDNNITNYIDDCVAHSSSIDENLSILRKIFVLMRQHQLSLNAQKCKFLKKELTFLGHLISDKGVSINQERIQAIVDYKKPQNLTELRAFIAFIGFFRNHIKNFSALAEPLIKILRKPTVFYWTENEQMAFNIMKEKVISPPILRFPDLDKPFVVHCDASLIALGAQLSQNFDDGLFPIHFASKTLSVSQRKQSVFEREFLAILFALDTFKHYLLGEREFTLFTDQKALIYAVHQPMEFNNDKINRYKLKLIPYNMKICHLAGKKNVPADFLSRIEVNPHKALFIENEEIYTVNQKPIDYQLSKFFLALTRSKTNDTNIDNKLLFENFLQHRGTNKSYAHITTANNACDFNKNEVFIFINRDLYDCLPLWKTFLKKRNLELYSRVDKDNLHFVILRETVNNVVNPEKIFALIREMRDTCVERKIKKISILLPFLTNIPSFLFREMVKFNFHDQTVNVTMYKQNVVNIIDENLKLKIIKHNHESLIGAHAGINRTKNRIKDANYTWPNLAVDVQNYVNSCITCATTKIHRHTKIPMCVMASNDKPFHKIYIDTVGKLPTTTKGNNYVLTVKDDFSKFIFAIPMKEQNSEEIALALVYNVFLTVGVCSVMVSDNANVFNSNLISDLCKLFRIKKLNVSIYHAQSNTVERFHKDMGNYLRAFASTTYEWDSLVQWAAFNHNTAINYSGFSPFELVFGRKALLPSDDARIYTYDDYVSNLKIIMRKSREMANQAEKAMRVQNKSYYDRNASNLDLNPGDLVYLKNVQVGQGQKLQNKYRGPLRVLEIVNDYNVRIQDGNKKKVVHKNLLKKHKN